MFAAPFSDDVEYSTFAYVSKEVKRQLKGVHVANYHLFPNRRNVTTTFRNGFRVLWRSRTLTFPLNYMTN